MPGLLGTIWYKRVSVLLRICTPPPTSDSAYPGYQCTSMYPYPWYVASVCNSEGVGEGGMFRLGPTAFWPFPSKRARVPSNTDLLAAHLYPELSPRFPRSFWSLESATMLWGERPQCLCILQPSLLSQLPAAMPAAKPCAQANPAASNRQQTPAATWMGTGLFLFRGPG
eukprot:1020167-Rhodomonas_salina.1